MKDINCNHYDQLIGSYIEICNCALDLNKDRFPFKQILGAARHSGKGRLIEVGIIDAEQKASYVMHIEDDCIVSKPHGECDDCNCDRTWCVTVEYLNTVVENPEAHIANPAIINWEWMYDMPSA